MKSLNCRTLLIALLITNLNLWNANAIEPASKVAERVAESARVLNEIMAAPDRGIPRDLLADAHCIAIIPSLKKAGFIFGAEYGKGVASCRGKGNIGWTGPSTVRIEGGSFGLQIGGAETDLVLLVMDDRGAEKLMHSKFTLGGDATVAAGPVGRTAKAQTDATMNAKILAYARSRGVFVGVALEGATLRPDNSDNHQLYSRDVEHKDILMGQVATPATGAVLVQTLNRYSGHEA
jgi:lipid-binding SYLF domain-containing protein